MKKNYFIATAILAIVLAFGRLGTVVGFFSGADLNNLVFQQAFNLFTLIWDQVPNNLRALYSLIIGGGALVLATIA